MFPLISSSCWTSCVMGEKNETEHVRRFNLLFSSRRTPGNHHQLGYIFPKSFPKFQRMIGIIVIGLALFVSCSKSACSDYIDCTSCASASSWLGSCRWCAKSTACHETGSLLNPCLISENISNVTYCKCSPTVLSVLGTMLQCARGTLLAISTIHRKTLPRGPVRTFYLTPTLWLQIVHVLEVEISFGIHLQQLVYDEMYLLPTKTSTLQLKSKFVMQHFHGFQDQILSILI